MIIQCSQCSTQFRLDDSLLSPNGRQVACSKCSHQWFVPPPQGEQTEQTPPEQPLKEQPQKAPPTPPEPAKSEPTPLPETSTTTVPPKRDDDDLSPLDNNNNSNPDFSMGDDITARLARIRESVQPKNPPNPPSTPSAAPTDTPPSDPTPNAPTPTATAAEKPVPQTPIESPAEQPPTPPKIGEPDTPAGNYQTVDDYGINDGAVFEKTPESQPIPKEPTDTPSDGETSPPSEEPVVKDIKNFESALSKASELAKMAELKDSSLLDTPTDYRDATTGELISDPVDTEPEPSEVEKTAKAENAIMQAVRKKKDGFKAKKEERPSHVQHNERSWLTQIIILLCVVAGFAVLLMLVAKDHIMEMFPETRPYYALVGAQVSSVGKGLVILEPTASISEKGGTRKLIITGLVENRLDTTEPLPTLLAQVKDINGDILVQWTFKAQATKIPPKAKVTYSTSMAEPSAKSNSVAVTIANMKGNNATSKPIKSNKQNDSKKISKTPKVTPVKNDTKKENKKQ